MLHSLLQPLVIFSYFRALSILVMKLLPQYFIKSYFVNPNDSTNVAALAKEFLELLV